MFNKIEKTLKSIAKNMVCLGAVGIPILLSFILPELLGNYRSVPIRFIVLLILLILSIIFGYFMYGIGVIIEILKEIKNSLISKQHKDI